MTVCDSAAADCPTWPGARHLVHWSVEDPSFVRGDEAKRLAAFRATRDDLRRRIDGLMEALRRSHPKRKDAELLETGAAHPRGRPPAARLQVQRRARGKGGQAQRGRVGQFSRRGRSLELQVRSGVGIALWSTGERRMLHPDYMECLNASQAMRYPGLSAIRSTRSGACARTSSASPSPS